MVHIADKKWQSNHIAKQRDERLKSELKRNQSQNIEINEINQ